MARGRGNGERKLEKAMEIGETGVGPKGFESDRWLDVRMLY